MRRRFQFSMKWLFMAMLAVGCFFGGMALQRQLSRPVTQRVPLKLIEVDDPPETMTMPDGSKWLRLKLPQD